MIFGVIILGDICPLKPAGPHTRVTRCARAHLGCLVLGGAVARELIEIGHVDAELDLTIRGHVSVYTPSPGSFTRVSHSVRPSVPQPLPRGASVDCRPRPSPQVRVKHPSPQVRVKHPSPQVLHVRSSPPVGTIISACRRSPVRSSPPITAGTCQTPTTRRRGSRSFCSSTSGSSRARRYAAPSRRRAHLLIDLFDLFY